MRNPFKKTRKILFPFYNQEIHLYLFSKKWFKFVLALFPIIVILITLTITASLANNLYGYCYDDLQTQQGQQTLDAAREINNLDFTDSVSELKAYQIINEKNAWFNNKISECRSLVSEYSAYMIPVGIATLIVSFYLIQFIFFRFMKNKSSYISIDEK